jgi:cytochrome c oxidase subunit 3
LLNLQPTIRQIGIAFALLSLTFFFGALIFAFAFRLETQPAVRAVNLPRALWLSTAFLAAASLLLEAARYALRRAWIAMYRGRLLTTVVFAVLFLLVQLVAALRLLSAGAMAAGNPQASAFYAFMSIHGAHVFGGVLWLVSLWRGSARLFSGTENDLRRYRDAVQTAATYWHFMGVLWLVLFFFLNRWAAR